MNKITKITALSVYLTATAFGNNELTSVEAYVAQRLGELKVHHYKNDFFVEEGHAVHKVQRCFVDKKVRGISKDNLTKFLSCGRVSVNRCGENEFCIKAHPRLVGGGPATAAALYWVTKIGCYGTAAAATATIATATAGTGLAALGGVGATLGGTVVASGAGVGAPIAGLVAGGIANAAAAEAAIATAGVVTSAGGIASAVAAVESAAVGAFAFGMMLPLP